MADPTTVPGLSVWFKADAITGLADGAAVSSWADSLGTSTAAQATAARQPLWMSAVLNGLPVVRFSGAQRLTLTGAALTYSNAIPGQAVFCVAALSGATIGTSGAQIMILTSGTSTGASRLYLQATSVPEWRAGGRRLDSDSAQSVGNSPAPVAGRFDVITFAYDYANAIVQPYLNGTAAAPLNPYQAAGSTSATNSQAGVIGSDNSSTPTTYFLGDVAEILVYNRIPTALERSKTIHSYLSDKYGIAVSDYTIAEAGANASAMAMMGRD